MTVARVKMMVRVFMAFFRVVEWMMAGNIARESRWCDMRE